MSKALPPVDVVIVVLCWRNQVYLPQLLASVAAQEGGLNLELVVCNNASVPLLLSEERAQPEKLHSIASGANLGYGGGNNFASGFDFCINWQILGINRNLVLLIRA